MVNRSLDWVKARQRRPEVSGEPAAGAEAAAPGDEMSAELMAALAALDPDQRALVVLRHVLGYPGSVRLAGAPLLPNAASPTRAARS